METPNFPKLLEQFRGDWQFEKLIKFHQVDYDTLGYEIETNHGRALILEIDFVYSLENLKEDATKVGEYAEFVPVKDRLNFEDSKPFKFALKYEQPSDWANIRKYANDKYCSFDGYFSFLIASTQSVTPKEPS